MQKKNKLSYEELEESAHGLQKELSKLLDVQQNLIDAQRRIDQGLLRSDVIQEYSKKVLYSSDLHNFYNNTVSSLIKAFDIDCSALFIYQRNNDKFVMVESSGLTKEVKEISGTWIKKSPSIIENQATFLASEKIPSSQFAELGIHHCIISILVDQFNVVHGILLGGISIQNQPFYDPIIKDHIPAFKVFTQQAQLCLRNIRTTRFIQQIIDKDPNLIYVTNIYHQVMMVNEAVVKYLNLEKTAILNKSKNLIYSAFTNSDFDSSVDQEVIIHRKEQTYEQEITIRHSGEVCWLQTTKIPIVKEAEPDCVLTISVDITLHKKATEELLKAQKSKELFMANMSHEIRTPLNAIFGFSSLLENEQLSDKQRKYLNFIKKSSNDLMVIITDILDMSAIEAGKLSLSNESFELKAIIESVHNSLSLQAIEKGIEFNLEIDPEIQFHVFGDPVRLGQVLTNISGNAIKFTDNGYVKLICSIVSKSQLGNEVVVKFTVVDTGIGIEENKLEIIFEIFSQVDPSSIRKYEGAGLGLAISKQLTELMNGQIAVQSRLQSGTQFDISIPFSLSKTYQIESDNRNKFSGSEPGFKKLNILIAEDNKLNLDLITSVMDNWEIQYVIANNGKEVIDKISENFDVILLDIQMPIMDGIAATKIIRKDLKMSIPIIAVTANAIKGDKAKFLQSGMNYYLSKPIDLVELKSILNGVLRNKSETDKMGD